MKSEKNYQTYLCDSGNWDEKTSEEIATEVRAYFLLRLLWPFPQI